jgi:hypothetical protein
MAPPEPERVDPPVALQHTDADWDAPGLWERVVAEVKERKLMVGVFLAESRRAGWEGSALCLSADEVHRSLLEARENKELLGEIMARVYGRPLSIRFVNGVHAAPAMPAVPAREEAPRVTVSEPMAAPEESAPEPDLTALEIAPASVADASDSSLSETAVSPEVQQAMVWFEGEIVRRADSGGVHP